MRHFIAGIFLIIANLSFAQFPCWTQPNADYAVNFDDGECMEGLFIDTVSNSNNNWQIGVPQKNTFNSAESFPNSIVTDTINPYPINDTSSFIFSHLAGYGFVYHHTAAIQGLYMANTDSLNDFGSIELSPDNGNTWIDLINDNTVASAWYTPIPILTGNSNGWQHFYFDVLSTASLLGIAEGDTIKYRFTFTSDGVSDSLDGLMFDSFMFYDYVEGIDEIGFNKIVSKSFPSPATEATTIEYSNPSHAVFELKLTNNLGEEMLSCSGLTENSVSIDLSNFDAGIYTYFLRSAEKKSWSTGKIVKVN